MRTLEQVITIVDAIDDDVFEKINDADTEYHFSLDSKERSNARKRLLYHLKKTGLSLDEWLMWVFEY